MVFLIRETKGKLSRGVRAVKLFVAMGIAQRTAIQSSCAPFYQLPAIHDAGGNETGVNPVANTVWDVSLVTNAFPHQRQLHLLGKEQ